MAMTQSQSREPVDPEARLFSRTYERDPVVKILL